MENVAPWSTAEGGSTHGPQPLAKGDFTITADLPVTLERLVAEEPATYENRLVNGQTVAVEVTPPVQTWEPVAVAFAVPEDGVYRVCSGAGKGDITIDRV